MAASFQLLATINKSDLQPTKYFLTPSDLILLIGELKKRALL